MKKLLLVFCVLLGLTGCGQVLDESFDKETLKQETIAIVENLNDENYDAIVTTVNDDLKDTLSASVIQKAWEPVYEKLGESRDKSSCTIKANGDYATVVLISNYANGKLQVTATYNTDMELIGLYIK